MTTQQRLRSTPFLITMAAWLVLAVLFGMSGRLAAMTPPLPQMIILGLTLLLILTGALHPGLHEWLASVNLRGFVAFHLTRFVGVAFLVLYALGTLPGEFAITAGWGDIITAIGALWIVLLSPNPLDQRRLLLLWNVFGLADILLVVVTATRIALRTPQELLPIVTFPMSLVPTFVVPIVIASHVLIFWRLSGRRSYSPVRQAN